MLKVADPIKTIGPNSLGTYSILTNVLIKHKKISGAEEPKASKVKLAMRGFQIGKPIIRL